MSRCCSPLLCVIMITPAFELSQDANFLTVIIRVPYTRTSEFDIYIQGEDLKFYAKPYFLRWLTCKLLVWYSVMLKHLKILNIRWITKLFTYKYKDKEPKTAFGHLIHSKINSIASSDNMPEIICRCHF